MSASAWSPAELCTNHGQSRIIDPGCHPRIGGTLLKLLGQGNSTVDRSMSDRLVVGCHRRRLLFLLSFARVTSSGLVVTFHVIFIKNQFEWLRQATPLCMRHRQSKILGLHENTDGLCTMQNPFEWLCQGYILRNSTTPLCMRHTRSKISRLHENSNGLSTTSLKQIPSI